MAYQYSLQQNILYLTFNLIAHVSLLVRLSVYQKFRTQAN
jgi:hypothetical protein